MQRGVLEGERGRINWGDLLDEAWGKEEQLGQPASELQQTCEDQDKENIATNATGGTNQHTRKIPGVGGDSIPAAETRLLFPEVSKTKPGALNRKLNLSVSQILRPANRGGIDNRKLRKVPQRTSVKKLRGKRSIASKHTKRDTLQQLCLDLGQRNFGHVTCRVCGMVYSLGQSQDEADHSKFHRRYLAGVTFQGWKQERVVEVRVDGRILAVFPDDGRRHLKKVQELCSLVDSELGYAAGVSPWRPDTKMYLYVSNGKKVMGCVFAERISEGYPVLGSYASTITPADTGTPNESSVTSSSLVSTSSLLLVGTEGQLDSQSAWYCSSTPRPAVVGINRVWVCPQHRRKGVASRILDAIRFNFIPGGIISKDQLAFSDPTPSGKVFAASYCGTQNFLVYHWTS